MATAYAHATECYAANTDADLNPWEQCGGSLCEPPPSNQFSA